MILSDYPANKPISLVGSQYALSNAVPLSSKDYRDLLKRRAVSILHYTPDEDTWQENEELRKKTEKSILEKINEKNNLLPIVFLSKGVEKAKAICRISTPSGLGTGFLIEKGILMTNHHVISSAKEAQISVAEFGYEEKLNPVMIRLRPEELFITSPLEELDFTIVGCEIDGIEEIIPIKLLRSPTTITCGEYANIIQHPMGRKKEVALQDNKVSFVYDKVIRYTTDTEPGSSGSAVFNNDWQLVALHHAGWYTDDCNNSAINEGIRISAIVSKLITLSKDGDEGAVRLIKSLEDTSPYLGFYDTEGLYKNTDSVRMMEYPVYKGNQSFGDIGYWNLDYCNPNRDTKHVKQIAHVIADLSMDTLGLVSVDENMCRQLIEEGKEFGATMDFVCLNTTSVKDKAIIYDTTTTKVRLREDLNQKYSQLLRTHINGVEAFPEQWEPLFALCTVSQEHKNVQYLMILIYLNTQDQLISERRVHLAKETISVIIEDIKQDTFFRYIPIVVAGNYQLEEEGGDIASISEISSVTLTSNYEFGGSITYMDFSNLESLIVSKDIKPRFSSCNKKRAEGMIVKIDKSLHDFCKYNCLRDPLALRLIYKDCYKEPKKKEEKSVKSIRYGKENTLEGILLRYQLSRTRAKEEKTYFDEASDKAEKLEYYGSISFEEADDYLIENLHRLLLDSHTTVFSEKQSRNLLFSLVDLHENRTLSSIYSGNELNPEQLIMDDFKIDQLRQKFLQSIEGLELRDREGLEEMFTEKIKYNVEHVVPLLWFEKKNPMQSDLHHMFACEAGCSCFRNSLPFFESTAGQRELKGEFIEKSFGKRWNNTRFEPRKGKGAAARAVLYFMLRYPDKINSKNVNIELLRTWHKEYPVTIYEKHRNQEIFRLQGNRNPLIDFPELAGRIQPLKG